MMQKRTAREHLDDRWQRTPSGQLRLRYTLAQFLELCCHAELDEYYEREARGELSDLPAGIGYWLGSPT